MKTPLSEERHVVPRWRPFAKTLEAGELQPLTLDHAARPDVSTDLLAEQLGSWHRSRSVGIATDLVGSALVLGLQDEAREAALFLLDNADSVSEPGLGIAHRLLGERETSKTVIYEGGKEITRHRRILNLYPRNPVVWMDLALAHTCLGQNEKANQAVRISLSLASHSRFVLRGAARFYVHIHEADRAQNILRRNPSIRRDPWLLAAEIASSDITGTSSPFIKIARGMLSSSNYSAEDKSELASALASLELASGNDKSARKLFRQALEAPTDNSVAQAEWAAHRLVDLEVSPRHLEQPFSYEARAIDFYLDAEWHEAINEARRWQDDELYSTRPSVLGSFIAAVILEDYALGEKFTRRGLLANPKDPVLLNNLAFCLASSGQVEKAEEELAKIRLQGEEADRQIIYSATSGLLKFRKGFPELGRAHYNEAIRLARKDGNDYYEAMAAAFLAREELVAGTNQEFIAIERVSRAMSRLPQSDRRILEVILERLATYTMSPG